MEDQPVGVGERDFRSSDMIAVSSAMVLEKKNKNSNKKKSGGE